MDNAQDSGDEDENRSLAMVRANDAEHNARTRIPDGEFIRLNSIRITEVFFPSHVRHLLNGLSELGWLETNRYGERDSLREWIATTRSPLGGRSWASIGTVFTTDGAPPSWRVAARRVAERSLPEGIERADFYLVQALPSVTAIVCEFFLSELASECLREPLSAEYVTELEPNVGGGHTIFSPDILRERITGRLRETVRSECAAVVGNLFPGFFAEQSAWGAYPSVDFISVEQTLLVALAKLEAPSFLNALTIDGIIDTFTDAESAVLLSFDPGMRVTSRSVTLVVTDPEARLRRSHSPSCLYAREAFFALFALRVALIDTLHELGELRDSLALGEGGDYLPILEAVREVETVFGSLSADLRPAISELEQPETIEGIKADIPHFSPIDRRFNRMDLPEAISTEIRIGARTLARAQQDLSASVQTISSLASAKASAELSRSNRALQRTAIAISVGSLIVALIKLITG